MPHRAASLDDIEIPRSDWERRADMRRADDRSLLARCRALANDVSKLLGIAVILFAAVAALAAMLGVRIQGPPETMAAITTRQDSLAQRVGRLEAGAALTQKQLGDLTGDVQFLSYLACVKAGARDAVAEGRCQVILRTMRGVAQ